MIQENVKVTAINSGALERHDIKSYYIFKVY